MEMTKQSLQEFRTQFNNAMTGLKETYGVEITLAGISYNKTTFTSKITVENARTDKEKKSDKESHFRKFANLYGLEGSDFGKTFQDRGQTYQITGISVRSRKYSIEVKCILSGKEYRMTQGSVKSGLLMSKNS